MKLSQINKAMREYNRKVAFGAECGAWQDFVEASHQLYGMSPWSDSAEEAEVTLEFADYWLDVAEGTSEDYSDYWLDVAAAGYSCDSDYEA